MGSEGIFRGQVAIKAEIDSIRVLVFNNSNFGDRAEFWFALGEKQTYSLCGSQ